jgi:hypothetical protein
LLYMTVQLLDSNTEDPALLFAPGILYKSVY